MAAGVFVAGLAIVCSVVYVNVSRNEVTGNALPQDAPFLRPALRLPEPPYIAPPIIPRAAIVGAVEDATKACEAWKSDDATPSLSHHDAAAALAMAALAMCDALTGQRTTVKAGSAAVSLDMPSPAIGFVLALFLWGVLVGLGSMFPLGIPARAGTTDAAAVGLGRAVRARVEKGRLTRGRSL